MFIDYVTLMLVNMVAGYVLLGLFVLKGLEGADQKHWVPGFAMTGFVALACGLHMVWRWPLPGSYNIAFGEMSVLFGVCFAGAAVAMARGWPLFSMGVYAVFAGAAAILIGVGIIRGGMTAQPWVAGVGFILSGLGGVLLLPVLHLRQRRHLRVILAIILFAAALIWALTGYMAYLSHLSGFAEWKPAAM